MDNSVHKDESVDLSVSWQSADLWENLSESEKEKINQKMSDHLVNYLTAMLMEEIKTDVFPLRDDGDDVIP